MPATVNVPGVIKLSLSAVKPPVTGPKTGESPLTGGLFPLAQLEAFQAALVAPVHESAAACADAHRSKIAPTASIVCLSARFVFFREVVFIGNFCDWAAK